MQQAVDHYIQETVCAGVKKKLILKYPNATIPIVYFCVRCKGTKRQRNEEECRFKGLRHFTSYNGQITTSFNLLEQSAHFQSIYPSIWNRRCDITLLQTQAELFGQLLLPLLVSEREHESRPDLIRRARHPDIWEPCDLCLTSLFSSSWMCQYCAWDICCDCLSLRFGNGNEFKHSCVARQLHNHCREDLLPVSRFLPGELERIIHDTVAIPRGPSPAPYVPSREVSQNITDAQCERRVMIIPWKELTDSIFDALWSAEDPFPILVTGAMEGLQLDWDPSFFSETFRDYLCQVQNCVTGEIFTTTVDKIFSNYGQDADIVGRMKDWPPGEDFKTTVPFSILCNDLLRTLPVRDVLRPDGCRNAISYFPNGRAKPDLGPKIYAAKKDRDNVGSTRLHGDVADAFNLCTHGEAIWIGFARKDAGKVNEFLLELSGNTVHQQLTFFTTSHLDDLFAKKGVKPFIIHQHRGDMIILPAGCLHQVSNQADSIKVACDFLHASSVPTCLQLTREFREENLDTPSDPWLRDVMQTKNTILYAAQGTRNQYIRRCMTENLTETAQKDFRQLASTADGSDTQGLNKMDVGIQSGDVDMYSSQAFELSPIILSHIEVSF